MTDVHSAALPAVSGRPGHVLSMKPVVLPAPDRGDDLRLRVTWPREGDDLPAVVFSHGFGFSMDGYGPLVDHWAAHGFVVIQPTHLDSAALAIGHEDPRTSRIWRSRIDDVVGILDELDVIEASAPGLAGRVDHERVGVAGHSYGATTASALLGARVLDSSGHPGADMTDARVSGGVLLALAGEGGENLTPFAAEMFPFMNPGFDTMIAPALITAGDCDQSPLSTRGPDWWSDGYRLSPGPKSLLTLFGADHSHGGIPAYGGLPATSAESPALVALLQRMTTAYLRTFLAVDDASWPAVCDALARDGDAVGRLQST